MVISGNCSIATQVTWIGSRVSLQVPSLFPCKNGNFYQKCIIGSLTLSVGDDILVANVDKAEPDTISGCDIAKILYLYENPEKPVKDPYRAVVQWFSRPKDIPHKQFDYDDICIDFDSEVIEDFRPYDQDISLESIFGKCKVLYESVDEPSLKLLHQSNSNHSSYPMFICRYKFIKMRKSYRLVPLGVNDGTPTKSCTETVQRKNRLKVSSSLQKSEKTPICKRPRRVSMSGSNPFEFVNVNYFSNENKVSPIKIVGGRSVVRVSVQDKRKSHPVEEEAEVGIQSICSGVNVASARRNLNQSLMDELEVAKNNECLNYSIVKMTPDANETSHNMKIKLRVSARRHSARLSLSQGSSSVENGFFTPTKKCKDILDTKEVTPPRRKSILKSGTKKMDGTPKRSIQLSDIVEKRIYRDEEIVCTPKQAKRKIMDPSTPKRNNLTSISPRMSKIIRTGGITPTIEHRHSVVVNSEKSQLQIAREQLHVSVIPKSLPCREKEFSNIYTFVESKIQDQCGGCMYISGVPGTGKTATVSGVIATLQHKTEINELPVFDFLEINGMRLTEPRQAYVEIYKQLAGKTLSWEHAYARLDKRFTTPAPHRITTVLLVDELDILCNRRQDVVYNLLNWPTKSAARLVVITIANTMDLPERLLLGKVTSRLGLTRLTFQPYSHKQLQEIVTARLSTSQAFKSEAVQLVARKVAAVSGDARRALDICRRATEIADMALSASKTDNNALNACVNIFHVQQALGEMIASSNVQAIKNCSLLEKIFLQAVVAEVTRTGVEETQFLGVYSQIETIASIGGIVVPTPGRALHICSKLGSERLIICEHSRNDIYQKILLNVSMDDVYYALRVT